MSSGDDDDCFSDEYFSSAGSAAASEDEDDVRSVVASHDDEDEDEFTDVDDDEYVDEDEEEESGSGSGDEDEGEDEEARMRSLIADQTGMRGQQRVFDYEPLNYEFGEIVFSLMKPHDIVAMSVVEVSESKMVGNNTIYDPRMGVIKNNVVCVTCGQDNHACPGHFGHITLSEPVVHPLFSKHILKYLSMFCHRCSRLYVDRDVLEFEGIRRKRRFDAVCEYVTKKISYCLREECVRANGEGGGVVPRYNYTFQDEKYYRYVDDKSRRVHIGSREILDIFSRIRRADLELLGVDGRAAHPRFFVITHLPVIPTCSRPFVVSGNGICHDDLSGKYVEIIKKNNKLRKCASERERQELVGELEFHVKTLMDNTKGKARNQNGVRPIKCFRERLKGKGGLFRNNLVGKRVNFSGRTVIGPDPTLAADEICIPDEFAANLTFPEHANAHNLDAMQRLVDEGRANYVLREGNLIDVRVLAADRMYVVDASETLAPGDLVLRDRKRVDPQRFERARGAPFVLRQNDVIVRGRKKILVARATRRPFALRESDAVFREGRRVRLAPGAPLRFGDEVLRADGSRVTNIITVPGKRLRVRAGDTVERQLRTGDLVLFGRQPTLHVGSVIARRLRLLPGSGVRTIRMNLAATKTYNADFDGDEMNIYPVQSLLSAVEIAELSSTRALIKSPQSAKLLLNICQDALTAGYLATRSIARIDVDDFNDAVSRLRWSTARITEKIAHVRRVLRWLGRDESLLYTGHGLVSIALPDDFEYAVGGVEIRRGVMLGGTLDKAALGCGYASIPARIEHDYGADACVAFVSEYQLLLDHYIMVRGFSIGMRDCVPARAAAAEIAALMARNFTKTEAIRQMRHGAAVREAMVNNTLNNMISVGQRICKEHLADDNNLRAMVLAGSKGSFVNISQITALVGQQNVNGQRIARNVNGRTLPFFADDAEGREECASRGFVASSFMRGLTPQEYFFHAQGGREGIIDTSIKTADSGYIQRKLVKKMEDITVSYNSLVMNGSSSVVQFDYNNGTDPAQMVRLRDGSFDFVDVEAAAARLNADEEWERFARPDNNTRSSSRVVAVGAGHVGV